MQINYELSEKDFVEAYGIHRQRNAASKWIRRLMILIMAIMTFTVVVSLIATKRVQATLNVVPFFG